MKTKDEAFDKIRHHILLIERKFNRKPRFLRLDNGKELINGKLKEWAAENGITLEPTAPYSPSQNGVAERFNRTLLELARAMLLEKNLPTFLWDEAVAHAAYLRNRAPTKALNGKTPYEVWNDQRPDVSHLREFGTDVWVLDESQNISKLSPRSRKMKLMGFVDGSKSIRYYDPNTKTVKVSRNFKFTDQTVPEAPRRMITIDGLRAEGEPQQDDSQTMTQMTLKTDPESEHF